MKKSDRDKRCYEAYLLLRRSATVTLLVRNKDLSRSHLSSPRLAIMNGIVNQGNRATISEIGRWLFRKRNTVKEIVDRMEYDGLVIRQKDEYGYNRKVVYVSLTPKGKKIFRKCGNTTAITKMMSAISDDQLEEFAKILQLLLSGAIREM